MRLPLDRGIAASVLFALLVACAPDVVEPPSAPTPPVAQIAADAAPRFSDWSAAVNVGAVVNSPVEDLTPGISKDGLSLYFGSPRPSAGSAGLDIWVSRRASVDAPWEPPRALGPEINVSGSVNDNGAALSTDGHRLYFQSNRAGGFGGLDLYVSRRHDARDDLGWEQPVNLGSALNSSANETGLTLFEDEATGLVTFYFASNRPGGSGGNDIYASTVLSDGTFGPSVPVAELNSPFDDQRPAVRRDGLEIFLTSTRPGTLGGADIWVATRSSTSEPWSTPVNLGPEINTVNFDAASTLSFDGTTLYFHSALRPGNAGDEGRFDIWTSTRTKLTGRAMRD